MTIRLMKPSENVQYDITQAVSTANWSGSLTDASRTLEFDYINAPYDRAVGVPVISTGDYVSLDEGGELFFGQIFGIERSSETGTITFTAYDDVKRLNASKAKYNFKNISPEEIARRVCADIRFPVGSLAQTGVNIASMLCNGTTFYDIILGAYTQAYKATGKHYRAVMQDRKLCVLEISTIITGFYLSDTLNITQSDMTESMDEIVNHVKIYDDKGNQIGEVRDDESEALFGTFQDVYEQEKGVDAATAAKGMLMTKPTQEITINAIGEKSCQSGYGVTVQDGATGLKALYWIKSDKHTWENGVYTMELTLSFDKIMDEKEIETEEQTDGSI